MHRQQKFLPIAVFGVAMLSTMGEPALAPGLPAITIAYGHIPHIEFWTKILMAVSSIFAAVGAPVFGWLSDRYGRKRAMISALLLWGLAGASGLIPQPFWLMMAGRSFLGFGIGGLFAINTATIADNFSYDRQRHMMGLQSMFGALGVILALVISGFMVDIHWRFLFIVFLPAFLVLPFVMLASESTLPGKKVSEKTDAGRGLYTQFGLLFGFTLIVVLAFNVVPTQMPFVMHAHGIDSGGRMGLYLAVLPISAAVAGRSYLSVSRMAGNRTLFIIAGGLMLSGFYLSVYSNLLTLFGIAGIGLGFGLIIPHINVLLSQLVSDKSRGRVMGMQTTFRFLGMFLSPIVIQPVVMLRGYSGALRFSGAMVAVAALLIFAVGRFGGRTE